MELSQLDVIAGDFDIVDPCPHRFVHVRYQAAPELKVEGVFCVTCGERIHSVKCDIVPRPARPVPFHVELAWLLAGRLLHSSVRGKESEGLTPAAAASEGQQGLDYTRRPSSVDPQDARDELYRSVGIDPDEQFVDSRPRRRDPYRHGFVDIT